MKSLKSIATSVSETTKEVKILWNKPKTWPNGIWLQVVCGILILGGPICIGVDYIFYEPIYFDKCDPTVTYASKACLERLDTFEKEYVRNEKFDTLRSMINEELVKKIDIGHLERLYKCLKERRYWQYEQCFIE